MPADGTNVGPIAVEHIARAAERNRNALEDAAGPPGEDVRWDELDVGIERVRKGKDIYYSGLSGPLRLERCGARTIGITASWTVEGGRIVDIEE